MERPGYREMLSIQVRMLLPLGTYCEAKVICWYYPDKRFLQLRVMIPIV
jgi:hypothetical protein